VHSLDLCNGGNLAAPGLVFVLRQFAVAALNALGQLFRRAAPGVAVSS